MRWTWCTLSLCIATGLVAACSDDSPSQSGNAGGSGGASGSGGSSGGKGGKEGGDGSGGTSAGTAGSASGGTAGSASGGTSGESGAGGSSASGGTGGQSGDGGQSGGGGEGGVPECTPANDVCPHGSYCTSDNACVPGCKDASSCSSGVCGATHDCDRCVADDECAEGRLCGTGICAAPCSEDVPESCGGERTCCDSRCVDTTRDIDNCGDCGQACQSSEFCGLTGCTTAAVTNVCDIAVATALLDGQVSDDMVAGQILEALVAHCTPEPVTRVVAQTEAEQINQSTGQVVASAGELLVFAGGPYWHQAMQYLENTRATPVYSAATLPQIGLYRSADDMPIVTSTLGESTESHDIIVIQIGRDRVTGTPALILYGFHEAGTRAAAWQFINVILPDLTSFDDAYYVYEWTDGDADQEPDADEFVLHGSGP